MRLALLSPAVLAAACLLPMVPLSAQGGRPMANTKASAKATAASVLVGTWSGTATVPLGDSTIVVPVTYTFTAAGATPAGLAVVPGQGSGPISNVQREGTRVRFRVTAPEGKLLDHDGAIGTNDVIEGFVNLDNKPVAKFRITPAKAAPPKPAPR
jgi:hypothetical protein